MHHEGFSVLYEELSEGQHTHTHTHTHKIVHTHTPAARHSVNDPSGVGSGQDSGSLNATLKYLLPR